MSLLALSLPFFLVGIPVLAGLLFLLHRLRIRHRRLEVVTTLFWQEAIEEARARVFVQRFRHPLVYAFLLFIALLLWTGFSDPQLASDPTEQSVILVEGSSSHMRSEDSALALVAVQDLLGQMPSEGRSVIWCGARERTLLGSGEHAALLEARWEGMEPEDCPSRLMEIVGRLAETQAAAPSGHRLPLHLILVGGSSLPKVLLQQLPQDMRVETAVVDRSPSLPRIRLVTLGLAPAKSGAWNRVDVLMRLSTTSVEFRIEPHFALAGKRLAGSPQKSLEDGVHRYLLMDLPAEGQLLEVFVKGHPELIWSLRLPERRILDVQIEEGLPPELRAVLGSDPGIAVVQSGGDVLISTKAVTDGTPSLWLNPGSDSPVFRFTHDGGRRVETELRRRFGSLGLDRIDARDIRKDAGAANGVPRTVEPVRIEYVDGKDRALEMPLQLLGEGYNLVQSRAFPLLVSQAVRWLAGAEEAPRRVVAGEILHGQFGAWKNSSGDSLDPVGASFFVPSAGLFHSADGSVLAASVQSPMDDSELASLPIVQLTSSGGSPLLFWITILAFLALVAEWILVRNGRMP